MKSSGDVRSKVAELLREVLPGRAQHARQVKGLTARECPPPGQILDGHPPDFAQGGGRDPVWISVTNPRHVPPMSLVDWRDGIPIYESRYALQIELWCLGEDWVTALAVRDEIEALVRAALISHANLDVDLTRETGYALHPPTVMSQFGLPSRAPNASGRTWAPALVSVDIRVEDSPDDPPAKTYQLAGLYIVKVPTGEAMPDPDTEQGHRRITDEWLDHEVRYREEFSRHD